MGERVSVSERVVYNFFVSVYVGKIECVSEAIYHRVYQRVCQWLCQGVYKWVYQRVCHEVDMLIR